MITPRLEATTEGGENMDGVVRTASRLLVDSPAKTDPTRTTIVEWGPCCGSIIVSDSQDDPANTDFDEESVGTRVRGGGSDAAIGHTQVAFEP